MSNPTVHWTSPAGDQLVFEVHSYDANWNPVSGLYMFCKLEMQNWTPLYIGQAESLKARLCSHDRWDEAARLGATTVLAATVLAADLDRLEKVLIAHFDPKLNVLLRRPSAISALSALPSMPTYSGVMNLGFGMPRK